MYIQINKGSTQQDRDLNKPKKTLQNIIIMFILEFFLPKTCLQDSLF